MPLSYRNIISGNKIKDTLGSIGDKDEFQRNLKGIIKEQNINPKYVKGYESETFWESVFGGQLGGDTELQSRFGQLFGFENKELDPYDPYTVEGAKKEEFWKKPGRILFPTIDEDVNTFRNVLFPDTGWDYSGKTQQAGWRTGEDQYEDPIKLGFEISFDINSPFFFDIPGNPPYNSIKHFIGKYGYNGSIQELAWRGELWREFKDRLFTIFEKNLEKDSRILVNKPYYINKISGLNNLNKKIINYTEDKITITLNEDVRMISWYLSELYNNLVYSYKDKRIMFPENLLRFDMNIKIHDIRNFIMPSRSDNGIKYEISPKSTIMFTLHDCSFDFFNSYNFQDEIVQAGYDASMPPNSELQFDIIYKSVTRWTNFALLGTSIDPWEIDTDPLQSKSIEQSRFQDLQKIKSNKPNTENKGFWNDRLGQLGQTVANAALGYVDNLETRLREERGKFVESSLQSFRDWTTINKIEPDNVYSPDFNNRLSLKNAGRQLAADILNDLEGGTRNITNF